MNDIEILLLQANNVLEQQYKHRIVELIRLKYDQMDENALLRQQKTKPEEFQAYFNYCEECKKQAKLEVYGEE